MVELEYRVEERLAAADIVGRATRRTPRGLDRVFCAEGVSTLAGIAGRSITRWPSVGLPDFRGVLYQ